MGIDAEMFVRHRGPVTEDMLRDATHKLYERFSPRELNTWHANVLEVVEKWDQDGPTIKPRKGETFIRVYLWTRYYGPGYERGNFRLIHDVAEALEHIFPKGRVWYGGDSSGVCAQPFGPEERAELRGHWLIHACTPYTRHGSSFMPQDDRGQIPRCRSCAVPMVRFMWGGDSARYYCECGERYERRGTVEKRSTHVERRRELFDLLRRGLGLLKEADPDAGNRLAELWDEIQ